MNTLWHAIVKKVEGFVEPDISSKVSNFNQILVRIVSNKDTRKYSKFSLV